MSIQRGTACDFTPQTSCRRAPVPQLRRALRQRNCNDPLFAPLSYRSEHRSFSLLRSTDENEWMSVDRPTGQDLDFERYGEPMPRLGLSIKRVVDLLLSLIGLALLWPLMLAIAFAVKLESPGPAVYHSLRAGKRGRKFPCYKFRTMITGADELKDNLRSLNQRRGPFFKIADDPRVTHLGRFLRNYSLDELPQLWNVLRGDMSLVGPRPHPLDDVERYSPEHHRRLDVKPGLTGLWQITARTDPSFQTCMVLDLGYIWNWSLLLDCKILMRTIPAVLAGEGQ